MTRYIPISIAVVAIAALTVVEGVKSERWGDSRLCAYCVTLLDDVPKQVGSWTGEDNEVDGKTQEVAGARGVVSRVYTNPNTQESVAVWLIVGHARDTARHTPDVCYGSQGNKRETPIEKHTLTLGGGTSAEFFTSLFTVKTQAGGIPQRVFWTWFKPVDQSNNQVEWIAPDNVRMEIAAAPALYKMYFTTTGPAAELEGNENAGMKFAREFMAVLNPILQKANTGIPADFDASKVKAI